MIEYPETSWFIKKYKHLLSNSSVVGYLFHLYIDRRFFKYYTPLIRVSEMQCYYESIKKEEIW